MSDDESLEERIGITKDELKSAIEQINQATVRGPTMGRSPFLRRGEKQEATIELSCGGTIMIEYWEPKERPDDAMSSVEEVEGIPVTFSSETVEKIRELHELREFSITFQGRKVQSEEDNNDG